MKLLRALNWGLVEKIVIYYVDNAIPEEITVKENMVITCDGETLTVYSKPRGIINIYNLKNTRLVTVKFRQDVAVNPPEA